MQSENTVKIFQNALISRRKIVSEQRLGAVLHSCVGEQTFASAEIFRKLTAYFFKHRIEMLYIAVTYLRGNLLNAVFPIF